VSRLRLGAALAAALAIPVTARAAATRVIETVSTRNLPRPVKVVVMTPPSYDSEPSRRFPVVYFLHDGQGDESVLWREKIADALFDDMRAGTLPEILLVAPGGRGSWFVNSFDGASRYATFLSEDLVPFVESRYRVIAERTSRAAAGISMGGYGAIHWGLSRPDLFAVVAGLSPAVQQLDFAGVMELPFFIRPSLTRVFGGSERANNLRANDLYDILLTDPGLGARAPEVLVRCGTEDKYRLAEIAAFFSKYLDAMGVKHTVTLERGIHDWAYWRRALPVLVRAVADRLAPPVRSARGATP
jgi:putative tributyrin esterase